MKKAKAPPSAKIFYEDKLTKQQRSFILYNENDLNFLKHKSLSSQQNKQLVSKTFVISKDIYNFIQGLEDDHASDAGVVEAAKNLLRKALRESVTEYLDNPSS